MDELKFSPLRNFGLDEMRARVDRARAGMAELGLETVLITSEANFRYFSGLVIQQWHSSTRPRYLLLSLKRDPIAVVPESNRASMEATSWVSDVRFWPAPRPGDEGVSLLVEACREAASNGLIGAELGPESRLGMPVSDFRTLVQNVGAERIRDGAPLLAKVRMIKSLREVACIETAARIVSDAFAALSIQIGIGDTERSACRKLSIEILRRGADAAPYVVGCSGKGGYSDANVGPTDRELVTGDILFIDTGSQFNGYWCDFDRHFSFGPPPATTASAYSRVHEALEAGIKAVSPGVRACDIWRVMANALGTAGTTIGRMGHGLGLSITEPPSIHPADMTLLEPGFVLTLEPSLAYEIDGAKKIMVHEENLAVTATGARLLSRRADASITVAQ